MPQNLLQKQGSAAGPIFADPPPKESARSAGAAEGDGDDSDDDLDLDINVDFMALSNDARKEINRVGQKTYGMGKEDFVKYLARDIEEAEEARVARAQEEEKAMLAGSGKKSRKDRRALRERRPPFIRRSSPSRFVRNACLLKISSLT